MLIKKSFAMIIIILMLALVVSACGSNAVTTTPPKTTASVTTAPTTTTTTTTTAKPPVTTAPPTTTAAPSATKPVVTVDGAATIELTSATLKGTIVDGQAIDQEGFEWGIASGKYDSSWLDKGAFSKGAYSQLITGLTEGTTYYFRGKAHNNVGWGYSAEKTFRTLGLPKITALSVNSGLLGQTVAITLTGIDFTGATAVSLGDGVTVKSYNVTGDTQIVVNITIAAGAATGARTVSVTTEVGTGTLAGGFTVKQTKQVKHTVIWSDTQFTEILHTLAPAPAVEYVVHFHDDNQMTLVTTRSFTLWAELRNGKLCFTNVQQSSWDEVFKTGSQYLSYDGATGIMTIIALPDTVLKTQMDVPVKTLPDFNYLATGEGQITVTYYALEEAI